MGGIIPRTTIQEVDGSPSAKFSTLKLPNGTLTDNGDGTCTYTPASSSSTPKIIFATIFESTNRIANSALGGSASESITADGLQIDTGGTNDSYLQYRISLGGGSGFAKLFDNSPEYSATMMLSQINGTGEYFIGIGEPTMNPGATGLTWTDKHMGFKIGVSGGVATLYATQANGTTQTISSALTTIAVNEPFEFTLKANGSSSVNYYWRLNGGSLSSATNLSTNVPTGNTERLGWAVTRLGNSSSRQQAYISSMSYSR